MEGSAILSPPFEGYQRMARCVFGPRSAAAVSRRHFQCLQSLGAGNKRLPMTRAAGCFRQRRKDSLPAWRRPGPMISPAARLHPLALSTLTCSPPVTVPVKSSACRLDSTISRFVQLDRLSLPEQSVPDSQTLSRFTKKALRASGDAARL